MAKEAAEGAFVEAPTAACLVSFVRIWSYVSSVLRRFAVLAYQRTSVRETRVKQKSYKKSYTRVQDYYLNGDDKRTRSDVYRANERHASRETDKLGERGRVLHATATDNYESGRVSWRRGEIHAKG